MPVLSSLGGVFREELIQVCSSARGGLGGGLGTILGLSGWFAWGECLIGVRLLDKFLR
jgi:hypothetical protein